MTTAGAAAVRPRGRYSHPRSVVPSASNSTLAASCAGSVLSTVPLFPPSNGGSSTQSCPAVVIRKSSCVVAQVRRWPVSSMDNVSVFFLAEGEQPAEEVMARLITFIRAAKQTLDFAIYDMRFSDPLKASLSSALRERAEAGVKIRFCYDADKPFPPNVAAGQDPAPSGTGAFVQSLGYPWRRIAGMKLMHSKFILRDGQTVWTGSANMTDDAFTLMENNIVEIDSQALANYYAEDFEQLWEKENFENTGDIHTQPVPVSFAGQPAQVRVMFSPGCGLEIDSEIARRVRAAQRRVRICSLLINSGTLIGELGNLLRNGRAAVDGIYDRTQMEQVYVQWQEVPQNRWKIPAL